MYSSTDEYEPSSDDHSSINSVIYVEAVPNPDSDLDSATESGRPPSGSPGPVPLPPIRDPRQSAESDHPHDSTSDSETSQSDRNADSDSSSSSDGTQV